jgi:SAM-dependent methyltransferase
VRLVFDAMVQASKVIGVGRGDSEADLDDDLALLVRAYRARGIDDLLRAAFDDPSANVTGYYGTVVDYYAGTDAQLTGVHNAEGAIHFGLDWAGKYSDDGFYEQARIVEALAATASAKDVLEVGSGKGFNSVFLARRNPHVAFVGVDLTPLHVEMAMRRGDGLPNLRFVEGDFHAMTSIADASVDVVFDVEAGCYSDTPAKLRTHLSEVHRVLRSGGTFVTFNYCRASRFEALSPKARLTVKLIERAWVIEQLHRESDWDDAAHRVGLRLVERRDLRAAATPSIVRLYRQARMFYRLMASSLRVILAKLVRQSTHNAVSALMLPYAFGTGALEYRMAVLKKSA